MTDKRQTEPNDTSALGEDVGTDANGVTLQAADYAKLEERLVALLQSEGEVVGPPPGRSVTGRLLSARPPAFMFPPQPPSYWSDVLRDAFDMPRREVPRSANASEGPLTWHLPSDEVMYGTTHREQALTSVMERMFPPLTSRENRELQVVTMYVRSSLQRDTERLRFRAIFPDFASAHEDHLRSILLRQFRDRCSTLTVEIEP